VVAITLGSAAQAPLEVLHSCNHPWKCCTEGSLHHGGVLVGADGATTESRCELDGLSVGSVHWVSWGVLCPTAVDWLSLFDSRHLSLLARLFESSACGRLLGGFGGSVSFRRCSECDGCVGRSSRCRCDHCRSIDRSGRRFNCTVGPLWIGSGRRSG
jgi:hypothetical protein